MNQHRHDSTIRDLLLAPMGHTKIAWAWEHMPILGQIFPGFEAEQPFHGLTVAMCLHLEAKTACLAKLIQAGGAHVVVTASNPLSTQDDVVAALVESGIQAFAWYGATDDEYWRHIDYALQTEPDLIVDDGADLIVRLLTTRHDLAHKLVGACEETTTGVKRLRSLHIQGYLPFPVIAVNNAYSKYLFDNRYGTGQSTWDAIMRTTNMLVAGKIVVVAGYGWCGRGIAMRAKGLGARVIVCEVDPVRANEALMDGFWVMPMLEAARLGDIFVTATGNRDVIHRKHFEVMQDGVLLANAGHFNVEISVSDLQSMCQRREEVRPGVDEYTLEDGKRLLLLGEGRLVNLACGDGHPIEIMDLSFSLQALSLRHLYLNRQELKPGVLGVPEHIDDAVAQHRLDAMGVAIDELLPSQEDYLRSW